MDDPVGITSESGLTIGLSVAAPLRWSTQQAATLFAVARGDLRFNLQVSGERLVVEVTLDSSVEVYRSQPLQFNGRGLVSIVAIWTRAGATLFVQNTQIRLDGSDEPAVVVAGPNQFQAPTARLFANTDPALGRTDAERLFLNSLKDIESRLETGDEYDAITAAGKLRLLLLDGPPLYSRVNTERHKLWFEVQPASAPLKLGVPIPFVATSLVPDARAVQGRLRLKLDDFLAWKVAEVLGKPVTVKEVILACANGKGGVHYGKVSDSGAASLIAADESYFLLSSPVSVHILREIGAVALGAMAPIADALSRSRLTVSNVGNSATLSLASTLKFDGPIKNFQATRSHVEDAIRNADIAQELDGFPSQGSMGASAISLFVKRIPGAYPFHLLVVVRQQGSTLSVVAVWRVYPTKVDLSGFTSPMDLLGRFVAVYGLEFSWENVGPTRFVGADPVTIGSRSSPQVQLKRPKSPFMMFAITDKTFAWTGEGLVFEPPLHARLMYCVDTELYYEHLSALGVHVKATR